MVVLLYSSIGGSPVVAWLVCPERPNELRSSTLPPGQRTSNILSPLFAKAPTLSHGEEEESLTRLQTVLGTLFESSLPDDPPHPHRLPMYDVLADIQKSLATKPNLLLEAPPGAGKTTLLPLAMLWWRLLSSRTRVQVGESCQTSPNNNQQQQQQPDNQTRKDSTTVQQIWVVEPRRVAARSAATRMSYLLGKEEVGTTVGYQMRGEVRGGRQTQINVVTIGILLQRLRSDPELHGIDAVVFDEFHERGVDSDVALALCRQTQQLWRTRNNNDLQIVVMSATLLGGGVTKQQQTTAGTEGEEVEEEDHDSPPLTAAAKLVRVLGGKESCDIIRSDGRQYPIVVYHANDVKWRRSRPLPLRILQKDRKELVNVMCDAIEQGILRAPAKGDVLAFLPGAAEIRRTVQQLSEILPAEIDVVPLYGTLSKEDQDYALFPTSVRRRVIVSSPIAEASLTLDRVTCVVDSGLRREPRCDVDTNMPRLVTTICSQASATQRAGRAGRVQDGICLRIYTQAEFENVMPEAANPEILSTDLSPTPLLLVEWGCSNQEEILRDIPFVDPPPKDSLETAVRLLNNLGALKGESNRLSITKLGQQVAALPTHPRIGTVLQQARNSQCTSISTLAAAVAVAFLLDDDTNVAVLNSTPNLVDRVTDLYRCSSSDVRSSFLWKSFLRFAARIGKDAAAAAEGVLDGEISLVEVAAAVGPSLLPGFIDLIGERKADASYGGSTYLLSLGRSARLDSPSGTSTMEPPSYAVVVETSTGDDAKTRIRAFASISKKDLLERSIEREIAFAVPSRGHEVRARRVRMIGSLELDSTPLPLPSPEKVSELLKDTIQSLGGYYVALTQALIPEKRSHVDSLFQRVRLAAKMTRDEGDRWPFVFLSLEGPKDEETEQAWETLVEPWLAPAGSLKNLDLLQILENSLSPEQRWILDHDFPTTIQAPDGSLIPVSYSTDPPSATAKLQQFFGTSESPRVGPRHSPMSVSLSLLSPAGKVVAQTIDLAYFWSETYPQVRAELRGRYAKHPWPEDPIKAEATRQTKKQLAQSAVTDKSDNATAPPDSKKKRSSRK